jgi:hypothetical protein
LERRRENMEWLKSFVRSNPGKLDLNQLIHAFSAISGLRPETVKEYVRTLRIVQMLVVHGGKVYTKDTLPPST